LLKTNKPKIFSDLDENHVLNLSVLYSWADVASVDAIKKICDNFCMLRVSRFRLGRREIIAVASSIGEPERRKVKSIKDLFSGISGR
jgi:hypothetical protein